MADQLIVGTTIVEKTQTGLQTLSIAPTDMGSENPATDNVTIKGEGATAVSAATLSTGVLLPQGATIISVIMYGNAGTSDETWRLERIESDGTASNLASEAIGTAGIDIDYPVIDNINYMYSINTSTLSAGDIIYGVKIQYNI